MITKVDLLIVGAGPAAMAAAVSAYDAGVRSILVLERGDKMGGILNQCIHNGFGLHYFKEELTGPEYAVRFAEQIRERGIDVRLRTMVLNITKDRMVTALNETDGVLTIQAGAVILGMGCRERTRGALNIPGSRPAGIFTAGAAQRFVNIDGYMPGKEVVILGSGDIGLIMARRMSLEGAHVSAVLELMPYSSGLARNIAQCLDDFGIPLRLSHTVVQIHGRKRLEGVTVARVDESRHPIRDSYEYIPCDTLLLSVGLIPENELSLQCGVTLDPITGGPAVGEDMQTDVPGVFACGNVVHVHDLVDFVTQESIRAGRGAAAYLANGAAVSEYTVTRAAQGIRYIVPQRINLENAQGGLQLFFRTAETFRHAEILVRADGEVIKRIKKNVLAPGEMESVVLTDIFNGEHAGVKEISMEVAGVSHE